jgi:Peptidase S24-like
MASMLETREDTKLGLAAEILRCHGTVRLKVWGTSMLPSVWPGDLLTIQSAAYDEAGPGDIVLVLRDKRFFVHRLVERRLDPDCISWVTRGDAMPHCDPPAAASELLGRVVGIRRANRSFVPNRRVLLLHSALAWMLCRWDRFRNLTLDIHAVSLQAAPTRPGQFVRGLLGALRGIPGISPSGTSHQ